MKINRAIFCLVFFNALHINGYSQPKGVFFENSLSWSEILAKAKNENKYIFLDCYATWCGPCKMMDKEVYPNDTVANYMNNNFISIKIQIDTSENDKNEVRQWYADAQKINQEYKIEALPSFLFFSPDGKIVHRDLGFKSPDDFILIANEALDTNKQYYSLLAKYRNRILVDSVSLINLVHKSKKIGDPALAELIANDYINALNENELLAKQNIELMIEFTKKSTQRGFNVFRYKANEIFTVDSIMEPKYSKNLVESIIYSEEIRPYLTTRNGKPDWSKIQANLMKYDSLGDEALDIYRPKIIFKSEIEPLLRIDPDWDKIISLIKKIYRYKGMEYIIGETLIYYEQLLYNTKGNKCKNLFQCISYYYANYPTQVGAAQLNEFAWQIFQYSMDEKELKKALSWSENAVNLEGSSNLSPYYFDTYANLLYKLGRKKEAISWEEKAVSTSQNDPSFVNTLKRMKAVR